MRRPCLDCGQIFEGRGARCSTCGRRVAAQRTRAKGYQAHYNGNYRRRAKAVRETATVCHLCGQGPREGDPWQADHIFAGDPLSPLAAAHRSCNAARGNRPLNF